LVVGAPTELADFTSRISVPAAAAVDRKLEKAKAVAAAKTRRMEGRGKKGGIMGKSVGRSGE